VSAPNRKVPAGQVPPLLARTPTVAQPLTGRRAAIALDVPQRTAPKRVTPSPAQPVPPSADPQSAAVVEADAAGPLDVVQFHCGPLAELEPHALGVTYSFDAAAPDGVPGGKPYSMAVQLTGQREIDSSSRAPGDDFDVITTVDRVIPGSGRVTVTTRVGDVTPGQWRIRATPVVPAANAGDPDSRLTGLRPAVATGATGFAPGVAARAPGVRPGAWPSLVGIGAVAAVSAQLLLASRAGLDLTRVLLISVLACLIGLVGAKVYAFAIHDKATRSILTVGMCIQGFVLAAIGTVVLGALVGGVPVGRLLDVTVPGLLLGMTIGRIGCLFGGCCAGRPTASRWGIWSSDRFLGVRRIPVQLLESAMAATLTAMTVLVLLLVNTPGYGTVFVAGLAAYTFGRQLLFPLRSEARKTSHGRVLVMAFTGIAVVVAVAVTLL